MAKMPSTIDLNLDFEFKPRSYSELMTDYAEHLKELTFDAARVEKDYFLDSASRDALKHLATTFETSLNEFVGDKTDKDRFRVLKQIVDKELDKMMLEELSPFEIGEATMSEDGNISIPVTLRPPFYVELTLDKTPKEERKPIGNLVRENGEWKFK